MTLHPPDFYAERCKSEDNLARYYHLQVTPTLFGDIALVRCWGRIGTRGQAKVMTFATPEAAAHMYEAIKRRKLRRGYQAVG